MMSGTRRSIAQSPPADHVPGPRRGDTRPAFDGEERAPERVGHELGAPLGARVRIVAAHRLVLAVAPVPLTVVVALVRGDVDDRLDAADAAHRLEHVDRAHDVRLVRLARRLEGASHERLRGHVDDDLRASGRDRVSQGVEVADVQPHVLARPRRRGRRRRARDVVGTSRETPVTAAPSCCSHSVSQLPLNPVWPVISTRRPLQNAGSTMPGGGAPSTAGCGPEACSCPHPPGSVARTPTASCSWLRSRSVSIACQKPSWRKHASCPSRDSPCTGSCSHTVASPVDVATHLRETARRTRRSSIRGRRGASPRTRSRGRPRARARRSGRAAGRR